MAANGKIKQPPLGSDFPQITLKGNAYQRGVQYGKALAPYLEGFYYWFVKKEPAELLTSDYRAGLDKLEDTVSRHFPLMMEEVKGP